MYNNTITDNLILANVKLLAKVIVDVMSDNNINYVGSFNFNHDYTMLSTHVKSITIDDTNHEALYDYQLDMIKFLQLADTLNSILFDTSDRDDYTQLSAEQTSDLYDVLYSVLQRSFNVTLGSQNTVVYRLINILCLKYDE